MSIDRLLETPDQLTGETQILRWVSLGAFGDHFTIDAKRRLITAHYWWFWQKHTTCYTFDEILNVEIAVTKQVHYYTKYTNEPLSILSLKLNCRHRIITLAKFASQRSRAKPSGLIQNFPVKQWERINDAMEKVRHVGLFLQKHVGVCVSFPAYTPHSLFS